MVSGKAGIVLCHLQDGRLFVSDGSGFVGSYPIPPIRIYARIGTTSALLTGDSQKSLQACINLARWAK
jgi:hypothetical protein